MKWQQTDRATVRSGPAGRGPGFAPEPGVDLEELRIWLGERVSVKGEAGWETARLPWNRHLEQRPELVVAPRSTEEVRFALAYARRAGLKVAVQSSGHGAGSTLGDLQGALLLDMSGMRAISVDPGPRRARVEAGVTWEEVMSAAAPHGLAGLPGSSPNVAVAGYCLGGGVGFLGRRYGLAANSVHALEVVLPDGRALRTDAEHEPELFWALRGGGGSFAVVTALEIELFPVSTAYAGFLFWPVERAREVLHAWLEWTRTLPDEVTSVGRILQFPPIPTIPEPMRGRALAGVDGAILAAGAEAERLLEPLRALGPEIDTFAEVDAPALSRIHLDPEEPVPAIADSYMVRFDPEALDALLAVSPPASPSALLITEVRHLGGALSRPSPLQGSAGVLASEYIVFGVGLAMSPEMERGVVASLDAVGEAMRPWLAPRQYLNLSDRPRPAEEFFAPADLARLRAARDRYDPERTLLSNRPR